MTPGSWRRRIERRDILEVWLCCRSSSAVVNGREEVETHGLEAGHYRRSIVDMPAPALPFHPEQRLGTVVEKDIAAVRGIVSHGVASFLHDTVNRHAGRATKRAGIGKDRSIVVHFLHTW